MAYYIEEFLAPLLHAENVKQLFCPIVLPDDGPVRPETFSNHCVVILL